MAFCRTKYQAGASPRPTIQAVKLYDILNFIILGSLFREYLTDSLLNAQLYMEQFITVVAIAALLLMFVYRV